jgi:K+-transporting ATPase ATPase B chain
MNKKEKSVSVFDRLILTRAIIDSFKKLNPAHQIKNPVMFVVLVGSILTTGLYVHSLFGRGEAPAGFILAVTIWLWFTLIFANFSEALAEGRGKAQADSLRRHRKDTVAKKLKSPRFGSVYILVPSKELRRGDVVLAEAGDMIPMDGEVIEGIASVDESAITGESAPVIRESGGDRSAVTGGTKVLSDWLIIKITSSQGETFLDRMIAMVEGAKRKKTPNEIALSILRKNAIECSDFQSEMKIASMHSLRSPDLWSGSFTPGRCVACISLWDARFNHRNALKCRLL